MLETTSNWFLRDQTWVCLFRGAIDAVKGYIAAGNPDNDGEQRLAGLESKIS